GGLVLASGENETHRQRRESTEADRMILHSRQSTHDANALRLTASSSHFVELREFDHSQNSLGSSCAYSLPSQSRPTFRSTSGSCVESLMCMRTEFARRWDSAWFFAAPPVFEARATTR